MRWIAREHQFNFPRPTIVMGIVNTTPDSFTDGGRFLDADAAGAHALRLASEGAEILDIGGNNIGDAGMVDLSSALDGVGELKEEHVEGHVVQR